VPHIGELAGRGCVLLAAAAIKKPTPGSQGVTPVPQPVRRARLGEGSGFRPGDDDAPARRGAPARRLARHL